eukprot:778400-Pleurochrysis_carterae.AAC.1
MSKLTLRADEIGGGEPHRAAAMASGSPFTSSAIGSAATHSSPVAAVSSAGDANWELHTAAAHTRTRTLAMADLLTHVHKAQSRTR